MAGPNLRITGGVLRGRILRATSRVQIRSTSAKVRAAIFNVIGPVQGLRVADLYCGSGALGIEALSRGAAQVIAIDNSRLAQQLTLANIAQLDPELNSSYRFKRMTVERWVGDPENGAPFDLVLMDPPYAHFASAQAAITKIFGRGVIAPGGLAVCEHSARSSLAESDAGFRVAGRYRYGDTAITLVMATTPDND